MKINQRGFIVEGALVISLLIGAVLLFIPNPVSSSLGVGIRPNKTVQTDATTQTLIPAKADGETLYHADGSVALVSQTVYKRQDLSIQQKVTLWEQIKSLPILWLILSILGAAAVPGFGIFAKINGAIKKKWQEAAEDHQVLSEEAKTIVRGLDTALATIPEVLAGEKLPGEIDRAELAKKIKDKILNTLSTNYDKSTKDLVRALRGA